MKNFIVVLILTLFLISPVLSLKAEEPKLRYGPDILLYSGDVYTDAWAVASGVDNDAIDVDYFAGDTLRAVIVLPDSTVRILRSDDRGENWAEVNHISFGYENVTEPHIVHGPDSTYHVFVRYLRDQGQLYTRAYKTSTDASIAGSGQYLAGSDSVKSYSVCTDRRTNHNYRVFAVYQNGLGGRGQDELRLTQTTDQGQNWSAPSFVRSGGTGFPDITYGNDQTIYVAFLQRSGTNTDVIGIRRSLNFGSSWSGSQIIQTDTFPKMRPQIAAAYDNSGDVWVIWSRQNLLAANDDWDLYWSGSQDSGATWTTAASVNSVADSNEYFPSMATGDNFGSTASVPYVSFIRASSSGTAPSVRSFDWNGSAWNTEARYSDNATTLTRPVQIVGPVPAIAYVGEGSENVYFDSWENSGVEEKDVNAGITCSLDNSIIAGTATLKYNLPKAGQVKISMFNVLGQEIVTLLDGVQESGENTLTVSSANLPQGIYYIVIKTSDGTGTAKATVIK